MECLWASAYSTLPLHGANSCGTYTVVVVARADGFNARTFALGDQPAWRPHP